MAIVNLEAAAGGNPALRKALHDLDTRVSSVAPVKDASTGSQVVAPPSTTPQLISVVGKDGKFIIEITAPAQYQPQTAKQLSKRFTDDYYFEPETSSPVYIKVQSATALEFDADSNVITYGPTTQTHLEDQRPNETRYFRFSMSYDQSTWSDWKFFNDPTICGPAAVWSGFLRSIAAAPNVISNVTNDISLTSTDNGTNATIHGDGPGGPGSTWIQTVGTTEFGPFPSALLPGFAYATAYTVMFDDRANVYHVFTDAQFKDSLADIYRWVGKLTTVAAGGGGGSTGGGGTGGGEGGCTEVGTPLYLDKNTEVTKLEVVPQEDWIALRFTEAERPLMVDPDTLVGIWVKARDLQGGELVDIGDHGEWMKLHSVNPIKKKSLKQKVRVVPHGAYRAGSRKVKLHNRKII